MSEGTRQNKRKKGKHEFVRVLIWRLSSAWFSGEHQSMMVPQNWLLLQASGIG